MGFLERMEGQTVYVDSPAFIYFFENNEQYEIPLDRFFTAMDQGHFRTVASTIVLAEILVKPCRLEQWELVEKYELILASIPAFVTASRGSEGGSHCGKTQSGFLAFNSGCHSFGNRRVVSGRVFPDE
ncbi:MAG: hypothetical protein FWH27_00735 [Planctomycetaceae bacterium]|nr:hypothetical protein [Planctomycetaceae bacterium]